MRKIAYIIIGIMSFMLVSVSVNAAALTQADFDAALEDEGNAHNGVTYNSTGDYGMGYYLAAGEYTLSGNLTLVDDSDNSSFIIVSDGATTINLGGATLNNPIDVYDTKLTINGSGTVTTNDVSSIFVGAGGSIEVNGGTFTSTGDGGLEATTYDENKVGSIVINGGTFTGGMAGLAITSYTSFKISGGTFIGTGWEGSEMDPYSIAILTDNKSIFDEILADGYSWSETPDVGSNDYMVFLKNARISVGSATAEEAATATTTYETLEGATQTYSTNNTDSLTFRFNADYAKFESNGKVYVDDTLVDSSNYTSKAGSTIIVFKDSYVKKLANGKHKLTVDFGDGVATTEFTITGNPNTGDNILFYVAILLISCLGIGLCRKKLTNE